MTPLLRQHARREPHWPATDPLSHVRSLRPAPKRDNQKNPYAPASAQITPVAAAELIANDHLAGRGDGRGDQCTPDSHQSGPDEQATSTTNMGMRSMPP